MSKYSFNQLRSIKNLFLLPYFLFFFNTNCNQSTEPKHENENLIFDWQSDAQYSSDGEKIIFAGLYDSVYAIHFLNKEGKYLGHILENNIYYEEPIFSSPSWGPYNNKFVVSMNGNLFFIKINGDSLTQLTFSWQDFSPSWSPDGKYVAYTKSICDPECGIALYNLNNNTQKVIGKYGGYASWNKNSDKIYYYHTLYVKRPNSQISDYKGFVFNRIDINTLEEDSLFHVENTELHLWLEDCTVSSDEKYILFAASEGAPPQVYIWKINLEQNTLSKMTVGNHPSFSPDGTTIVYTNTEKSEGGLWVMNIDGFNKQRLTKLNR